MATNTQFTASLVLTAIDKMSNVVNTAMNKSIQSATKFKSTMDQMATKGLSMENVAQAFIGSEIVKKPIEAFAKLEDSADDLKASMMLAGGQVDKLFEDVNETARKLGNTMPGNTIAMNHMMTALIQNGVTAQDIIGGVGAATANFAIAMNMPYDEAANYVGRLKKTTGVATQDMMKFMDVITRTKNLGLNDPNEMKEAFGRSGMTVFGAKGLKDAQELAAVFSKLIPITQSGEMAGTGIRRIMTAINNPDEVAKMNAEMSKYGINMQFIDKATGKFLGYGNLIEQFGKLAKLRPDQRTKFLDDVFGARGILIGGALADIGVKGYNEALTTMFAQGTMEQKVAMKLKSLEKRWQNAKGNIENAMASLGETVAHPLITAVNALAKGASAFQTFMVHSHTAGKVVGWTALSIGSLIGVVGALGVTLGIVAKVVSFSTSGFIFMMNGIKAVNFALFALRFRIVTGLIPALQGMWASLTTGKIAMAAQATWSGIVAAAQWVWNASLYGCPIVWIIAGIMAVIGVVILMVKYWKNITGFFAKVWEGIKGVFTRFNEWFKGWGKWILLPLMPFLAIPLLIINNWSKITSFFTGLGQGIKGIFNRVVAWITNLGKTFYNAGANIVRSIWDGMKSIAMKPVETIKGIVQKIRDFLPFSPAKTGPLKDIHKTRIIETIADSMKPDSLVRKMQLVMAPVGGSRGGVNLRPQGGSSAMGGLVVNYAPNITLQGTGVGTRDDLMKALKSHETDLVRLIQDVIKRKERTKY